MARIKKIWLKKKIKCRRLQEEGQQNSELYEMKRVFCVNNS